MSFKDQPAAIVLIAVLVLLLAGIYFVLYGPDNLWRTEFDFSEPVRARALIESGNNLRKTSRFAEAQADCQREIGLLEDHMKKAQATQADYIQFDAEQLALAYIDLAELSMQMHRPEAAEQALRQVTNLPGGVRKLTFPAQARLSRARAHLATLQAFADKARVFSLEAEKADHHWRTKVSDRVAYEGRVFDTNTVVARYRRATNFLMQTYQLKARAARDAGNFREAESCLGTAIKLEDDALNHDPGITHTFGPCNLSLIATMRLLQGDKQGAFDAYQKALAIVKVEPLPNPTLVRYYTDRLESN